MIRVWPLFPQDVEEYQARELLLETGERSEETSTISFWEWDVIEMRPCIILSKSLLIVTQITINRQKDYQRSISMSGCLKNLTATVDTAVCII